MASAELERTLGATIATGILVAGALLSFDVAFATGTLPTGYPVDGGAIAAAWFHALALAGLLVLVTAIPMGGLACVARAERSWRRPPAFLHAGIDLGLLLALPIFVVVNVGYLPGRFAPTSLAFDGVLLAVTALGARALASRPVHRDLRSWSATLSTVVVTSLAIVVAVHEDVPAKLRGPNRDLAAAFAGLLTLLAAAARIALYALRSAGPRWFGVTCALGGGVLFVAHRTLFVGHYEAVHVALLTVAWALLLPAATTLAAPHLRGRRSMFVVLAAAVAAVVSPLTFSGDGATGALVLGRTHSTRVALGAARSLVDVDRDGYASLWDGGDPDDFDGGAHPLAAEIVGNGVDDNGLGGDLSQADVDGFVRDRMHLPRVGDAPPLRGLNVVWIQLCTVRADRLGFLGHERPLTPRMDGLAAQSVVFERAYTHTPWTDPAIATTHRSRSYALFGRDITPDRYAGGHRVDDTFHARFRDDEDTLRQSFEAAGYRTALIGDDDNAKNARDLRSAISLPAGARDVLAELAPDPFFLHVHIASSHRPYGDDPTREPLGDSLSDRYDARLRVTDDNVGAVLDALDALDLTERTLVVLVADHGEQLDEHGVWGHGHGLWQSEIHVPLLIRIPGNAPQRVATPVSNLDLAPTLVEAFGLPWSSACQGRSLLPSLTGETPAERDVFAQNLRGRVKTSLLPDNVFGAPYRNQVALIAGNDKLIYDRLSNRFELYDVAADPGEVHDLYFERRDRARELRRRLGRWVDLMDAAEAVLEATRAIHGGR